ncbi:DUF3800 domain-containing protein [Sediminibacterium ginsengisoli]|uniref:DUF3800 domain-containing protein n=1 Tax=Sediminibacterium ginsengisoli TaxID=413434 RepID=A0A1T4M0Z4_9BACT|nr:DUF3800 domain-containing protein [Sediminibacterium ginsengisoli]SJZ60576.1 Protein of unknown function [Sediminibacterium ginsengisoli]
MPTYNLYCDESCHLENDNMPYMLLGYVCVPYNQMRQHNERIKQLKEQHHFYGEIKWSKVSNSQHRFYNDLIDYFFATDLFFRAIVIKKEKINNSNFNQDYNTFYYKMYYQLLNHKLDTLSHYNIYLDIKDTLSTGKINHLRSILHTKFGVIRNLQNIHSNESVFLQITDLIMGAIGYHLRGNKRVLAKTNLINRIQKHSQHQIDRSTPKNEDKLNLFFIELQ